ncbi:hypothetical protein AB0J47_36620 [Nocardia sp. NPDC049737]|uniref:hypothetical protein n=1 Tax=Nocardia sp. NPDC049737 TaxID=3154358 RepID=UPI0034238274
MADGSTEIDPGVLGQLATQHHQVATGTVAWASAPSVTTDHTTGADKKLPPDPQGPPPGGQNSPDGKNPPGDKNPPPDKDKRPDPRDKPPTTAKHYGPPIELDPPPGASAALKSFVAMAEAAIQSAVDLLGRGVPEPPPEVGDLLRTVVYKALGKGEATVAYQQAMDAVRARQTSLLQYDNEVAKTAIEVVAKKDETLAAIMEIVHTLQTDLKVPITGKHKAEQEMKLMEKIATAVEQVYRKVEAVYQNNQNMAGKGGADGSGSGSSDKGSSGNGSSGNNSSGGSGGSGGGDGGLGQIFQTLAMLVPVGVMAATPVVTALMENDKERREKEEEKAKAEQAAQGATAPGAQGATAAATVPADPNAAATAAPAVTTPATQAPAAPVPSVTSDPSAPPAVTPAAQA